VYSGQSLNGAHTPRCLGPHTSSVLLTELDAAVCASTDGDEEACSPDRGNYETDREEGQALSGYDEGLGGLDGS
jgi:hypothetical protein